MGTVYLAQDPNLSRAVAIKVIHAEALGRSPNHRKVLLQRFAQEAAVLAKLRSPSIVEVFDFDTQGGTPYLVMEFVDGQTLEGLFQQLHGQALDPIVTACLLVQTADGLCAAEKLGVIHRDLKPANLLLHQDGVLKIADFGIAHWADHSTTRTGMVLGSQFYMSPEQAEGKRLTIQSDLFALGTVAYQCLTGAVPFPGDSQPAIARKICFEPHVPLIVHRPDLDPTLVHVVEALLQKDPLKRGSGPRWVRDTLRTFLHHRGVLDPQDRIRRYVLELARQGLQTTGSFDRAKIRRIEEEVKRAEGTRTQPPPPNRPRKRRGVLLTAAGGLLLLVGLGGAGLWAVTRQDGPRPERFSATPPKAVEEPQRPTPTLTPVPEPQGTESLPPARPEAPAAAEPKGTSQGREARPRPKPKVVAPAPPPPVLEGETIVSIVSSPPFAELYLNGAFLSTAPLRERAMPSGRYHLRVEWKNAEMGVLDTTLTFEPGRYTYRFYLPGFREGH